MKLLMLTHRVPYPPDRGDRIRSYHLLRYLSSHADVSLGCVTQEETPDPARKELHRLCQRVHIAPTTIAGRAARDAWALAMGRSATEGHFWSPSLAKAIRGWACEQPFDAIVCFCSGMYRYTRLKKLRNLPTVIDLVDIDSQKWSECAEQATPPKAWVLGLESHRVKSLEKQIANTASEVITISEQERDLLGSFAPRSDIKVATNGVDTDYFRPASEPPPCPRRCCFVGVLNYQPNVDGLRWFTSNVWPQVRRRFVDARLDIVGKSPNAEVKAMASLPGVQIHADVPDVRHYLTTGTISVAPLQIARGIQNKVLEAMSMGLPVVSTEAALTGIRLTPGEHAWLANSPEEWVDALSGLFDDESLRADLGGSARRFVEREHSWTRTLAPFGAALGFASPSSPGNQAEKDALLAT